MLTVRLSEEEEETLNAYCQREGVSKSIVVKEAIELYLAQRKKNKNPYEAGTDLFGREGSGIKNKSVSYKKRLKDLLHEKHSH
ncbi:MAG: CopG family transcriptional regulator [Cyclobacteriaceae bacterium]|nr:CopG family transcriptional regulator [Cyclobacteriaceae bacterium]